MPKENSIKFDKIYFLFRSFVSLVIELVYLSLDIPFFTVLVSFLSGLIYSWNKLIADVLGSKGKLITNNIGLFFEYVIQYAY